LFKLNHKEIATCKEITRFYKKAKRSESLRTCEIIGIQRRVRKGRRGKKDYTGETFLSLRIFAPSALKLSRCFLLPFYSLALNETAEINASRLKENENINH
jgi:hypothetical protein